MAIRTLESSVVNEWKDLYTVLSIDKTYNISLHNKTTSLLRVVTGADAPTDNNDGIWIKSGDKLDMPAHTDPSEKVWIAFKGAIAVSYWK